MSCQHCKMAVEKAIKNVDGVDKVKVKLKNGKAGVEGNYNPSDIIKAVADAGYEAKE